MDFIPRAYAQAQTSIPLLKGIESEVINPLIKLMFGAALIVFVYGIFEFMTKEEKRDDGKRHMLWGVVGLFIMVAVFGILNVICSAVYCH